MQVSYAQLESAHWYFGRNAGLDFTSGSPVAVYDGALQTIEGCSSISDKDGNLLFYTDGTTVYNRNHLVMENGTGLNGNPSSTQSGIIIPVPSSDTQYIIFTVDADDQTHTLISSHDPDGDGDYVDLVGLQYTVVDMSANGGLGAIDNSQKNVNLDLDPLNPDKCSEKISAVLHSNGEDIWVVTHYVDSFYSFLVTASGVNPSPIVTTIGPLQPESSYPVNARGYLKLSPNGKKIAVAHLSSIPTTTDPNGNSPASNAAPGYVGVYDFNSSNGTVSNEIVLNEESGSLNGSPYGIEFSPNSRFLYAQLDFHTGTTWTNGVVYQYDLESPTLNRVQITPDGIFADHGTRSNSFYRARGALQLGLDQRIYLATVKFNNIVEDPTNSIFSLYDGLALSVIENPDEPGLASNYSHEALIINTPTNPNTFVAYGLPPFITSFFLIDIIIDGTLVSGDGCVGSVLSFSVETNADVATIEWDFGDGTVITVNNTDPVEHQYNSTGVFTVTATVTDVDGRQAIESEDIEIFETPIVQNTSLVDCENVTGSGISTFDLTSVESVIVDDPTLYTITYHVLREDAEMNQNPIANPTMFDNTTADNQTVFAHVENSSGCSAIAEIELTIHPNPILNDIEIEECEDVVSSGIGTFDLTQNQSDIISNPTDFMFVYYLSDADAQNENAPITNPTSFQNTTANNQTIFVRITNNTTTCFEISEIDLIVNAKPIVTDASLFLCESDGNGMEIFDLTSAEADISTETNITFTYFEDENDAVLNQNAITNPTNFQNTVTSNQIIYVRVENDNTCFDIAELTLEVFDDPVVMDTELALCESDGNNTETFDLTLALSDITSETGLTFSYFETEQNAIDNTSPIPTPNAYNNTSNNQIIYVRVENANTCFSIAEIELIVNPDPIVNDESLLECESDGNGIEFFDLTSAETNISTEADITFSYFEDENDATLNQNAITNPDNFENTDAFNQTIYVRVTNNTTSCFSVAELELTVSANPVVANTEISVCASNVNGFEVFDLTQTESDVTTDTGVTFTYFENQTDAETNQNAITNATNYTNEVAFNDRVFVRSEFGNGCFSVSEINLIVSFGERLQADNFTKCDINNDTSESFNLQDWEPIILALDYFTLPNDQYSFSYYTSEDDAINGDNEITDINNYLVQTSSITIYARVNIANVCDAIVDFDLVLLEEPFTTLTPQEICPISPLIDNTLTLDAGAGFTTYQWSGLQGNDANQDLTLQTVNITLPGTYTIQVTNANGCPFETSVEIMLSELPTITQLIFSGNNSQNIQIIAEGQNTPLTYSVDDLIHFILSNQFNNVAVGEHTAYVKNSNGCVVERDFDVFQIPNLITPNQDGHNDGWIVPQFERYNNIHVQIFDRYGKNLVDKIHNPGTNIENPPNPPITNRNSAFDSNTRSQDPVIWDGTYLGRPVPSTSYWYLITLEDGRQYKGWLGVKNY